MKQGLTPTTLPATPPQRPRHGFVRVGIFFLVETASTTSTSPGHTLAKSRAFREAALRSEVQRAYAVIVVAILAMAVMLLPGARRELSGHIKFIAAAGIGILTLLQFAVVAFALLARRRNAAIPEWFVIATVVLESLIPGGMIFWQMVDTTLPPYAALIAPPILAYGLMLCLTTLRLRPSLCILAGAVSAATYGAMVMYVKYGLRIDAPTTGLPAVAYVNASILIFITGLGAAWVAREIRGHMEAALGEAETRRQMDRIERDLAVARTIQRALLPRGAPEIAGFEIAGWNQSADQTGGDYYDWHALPNGKWIVTLADVSGHGIGPAMVTAACRAYVRASSSHHENLASLTSRINGLLADDLPEGRFVTMVSVLIEPVPTPGRSDPATGAAAGAPIALLSAGHGPIALYVSATGSVQDILPQDLPLAVLPDLNYGPGQGVSLAPGDVLALVTDGFVEWARPSADGIREEFGMARLRDSLIRHAHLSASAMIAAVAADVTAFAKGEPQQDDLTMVIIRRVGRGAS